MARISQPGIREAMPLLCRNEGVWDGVYRYYDAASGALTSATVSSRSLGRHRRGRGRGERGRQPPEPLDGAA